MTQPAPSTIQNPKRAGRPRAVIDAEANEIGEFCHRLQQTYVKAAQLGRVVVLTRTGARLQTKPRKRRRQQRHLGFRVIEEKQRSYGSRKAIIAAAVRWAQQRGMTAVTERVVRDCWTRFNKRLAYWKMISGTV
jgi:hypothetical protein